MNVVSRSALQGTGVQAAISKPFAFSCKVSRRRPQAFTAARKLVVQAAAAADSSDAAPAPKQQRQRRAPRAVTVQIATIQPGQELEGVVSSVEAYGAFVNVGAETDGLVHVSQLTDGYVKNVADVVKVGDKVSVKVLTVDAGQRRLALTMKGMGAAPGAAGRRTPADAFVAEDVEDADDGFALEAGDVAYDGVVFRVDDGAYDTEGYDEGDEYEAEAEGEVALAAALEGSLVEGTVASVEEFGVVVEWAAADGAKRSGLLHVSEMRAPAAAAAEELGEAAAAPGAGEAEGDGEEAAGLMADEAEFEGDQYLDVGGVDDPSRFYKVGDAISCYVLGVEGRKVELTQDLEAVALDDAIDEEGEEMDYEEERALAQADADESAFVGGYGDEDDEGAEPVVVTSAAETSANIYYGQSVVAAKTAGGPAFIRGKRGAAIAPQSFPDRGFAISDANLRVAATNRLVDTDDAGDEDELVDYWTDTVGPISKGRIAALGGKIQANEEGELSVVAREGSEADGLDDLDALEILNGVSDADLDDMVDMLLAEDADEAEVPFLARRNPGSMA